jgi:NAD(P)H dehydrogenase (quinone)
MRIFIVYYSLYGHIHQLALSVAKGIEDAGYSAELYRVAETLSPEVIEKMGAAKIQESLSSVPIIQPADLSLADAVIFGTPTRFGNMCGQMRQFLDATGGIWKNGGLAGKVGSVFTSSATQHGGQESTILTMHVTLLHHGMIIAGLPYVYAGQSDIREITGCSPYGASTITGGVNERHPSDNELGGARYQGRYVAKIAERLFGMQKELLDM